MMSSNTHFFQNFSTSNDSSETKMASFDFMESSLSQLNPDFLNFSDFVQFTSEGASQNLFLMGPTQSYDTLNPYQDSTTHSFPKDHSGLYTANPFESNHQPEITQMPPSVLENHKKTKGREKKNNVEIKGGINKGWWEKATVRCKWSKDEDRLLVQLVKQHGEKNWARIADKFPVRIGKQCRDRWHNCLRPNIMKNAWSEEDDKLLITLHKQFGNKWADISRNMPGRSENSIKNHWNGTKRKLFSSKGLTKTKFHPSLLKSYITSVTSSSSDNQINIQESSGFDLQSQQSMMSLNARSSSFSGSGVVYKPDEVMVNETDFDFDEVSSYLIDQLHFDPKNDVDFIGSTFGIGF